MCTKCKKTFKLDTFKCSCGSNLKKKPIYRVRVKTQNGWQTGTTTTLSEAKKLEKIFLVQSDDSLESCPTISDVWPLYIDWAKIHKRSWDVDIADKKKHLEHQKLSTKDS